MPKKATSSPPSLKRVSPSVSAASAPALPRPSRRLVAVLCLLIALATVAVYAQTYRFGFIEYDDNCYVYDNPAIKDGLTPHSIAWAFTTLSCSNYHPLTWLSHMVDWRLFGGNAGPQHLVNVALHICAALILFLAFLRMTARPWRSAIVAAVFAVHPVHAESVVWVAERKDVLSAFWAALALLLYARYAERPSLARYLPMALAFALGLLSKSMLVTLPFVLLLLDVWPLGRISLPPRRRQFLRLFLEKCPLLVLSAAASIFTYLAQSSGGAVTGLARMPLEYRLSNTALAYATYVWKAFWPAKLGIMYPFRHEATAEAVGAFFALLAVTVAVVIVARKRPYLFVGWCWYLGMLVPVIGLLQVGAQSMADRYMYLPLVGLSFAVVWLVADMAESRPGFKRITVGVACVAMALFCAQTYRQASYWRSSESLFRHTIEVTGPNAVMHKNLGGIYDREGRRDEALAEYRAAVAINPPYAEAHNGLGLVLSHLGRTDEALAEYKAALSYEPDVAPANNNIGILLDGAGRHDEALSYFAKGGGSGADLVEAYRNLALRYAREGSRDKVAAEYMKVLELDPNHAEAHNNLGVILAEEGRGDEALAHYTRALASRPDYAEAHANLAHELLRRGKPDECYAHLTKALSIESTLPEAHADLGTLLAAQGRFEESRTHLEASLAVSPAQPGVHSNLAFVLLQLKRVDESILHSREAIRLQPNSVDAHYNLAAALAAQGNKPEALAEFTRVLSLSPNHAGAKAALDALGKSP